MAYEFVSEVLTESGFLVRIEVDYHEYDTTRYRVLVDGRCVHSCYMREDAERVAKWWEDGCPR
jgi:hypothetical protein